MPGALEGLLSLMIKEGCIVRQPNSVQQQAVVCIINLTMAQNNQAAHHFTISQVSALLWSFLSSNAVSPEDQQYVPGVRRTWQLQNGDGEQVHHS